MRLLNNLGKLSQLSFIWSSTMLSALLAFGTNFFLANYLGASDFGDLSSVINLIAILVPVSLIGINTFWLRFFGKNGYEGMEILVPSLRIIFIFTLIIIASSNLIIKNYASSNQFYLVFFFLSFIIFFQVILELLSSIYQLEGKFKEFSLLKLIQPLSKFIFLIVAVFLLGINASPVFVAGLFSAAIGTCLVFYISKFYRVIKGNLIFEGHSKKIKSKNIQEKISSTEIIKLSLPYGLVGILYMVWNQGHVVLSRGMLGAYEAGIYSISLIILTAICMLPSNTFSQYFLPKIHRLANQNMAELKRFYNYGLKVMFVLGLATFFLVQLLIDSFIAFMSKEYFEAGKIMKILAFTLPMRFIGYNAGALLVTETQMFFKLKALSFVCILNIIFIILFIQEFGILVFPISIVISEAILVLIYMNRVRTNFWNKKSI